MFKIQIPYFIYNKGNYLEKSLGTFFYEQKKKKILMRHIVYFDWDKVWQQIWL